MTEEQFGLWLNNPTAIRCILVEVDVKQKVDGVVVTRYLSNRGYVTAASDSPANTLYSPVVSGGVKFNQSMSLEGSISLSFGDIELNNTDGSLDSWLDDYWTNRDIKVFIGDVTWPRADYQQIFGGVVVGIDTRKRDRINIKLSDKLQRLNTPATEHKLGGTTTNADSLIPLCFGECHNVEPLLIDPALHEYQIHDGAIERIIEVRDNGVPVAYTPFLDTGKFRLVNNPVGQITASVQGYVSKNYALHSQTIDHADLVKTGVTVSANALVAPDGTTTMDKIVESALNESHVVTHPSVLPYVSGVPVTLSLYTVAAGRTAIRIALANTAFGGLSTSAFFNLSTGTVVSKDAHVTARVTDVGGGIYRCSITATPTSSATLGFVLSPAVATSTNYLGNGTSGVGVWGLQWEYNDFASTYTPTTTQAVNIYPRTVGQIVRLLATKYGTAPQKLSASDIDLAGFDTFDAANPEQVGIYLKDRSNVLEACSQISASIGARLVASPSGLVSLVKLDLPQTSTGTLVTSSDIADRSLEVSQMPAVVAGVKIGYCKNWTVQPNLATGIIEEHRVMFGEEWLTTTQTDTAAAANFNLYTEPTTQETLLVAGSDAVAEASRRLNIFNVQRKVVKYRGYANLLTETLGQPQTITHSRFGLSGGVRGQIVSISTDWINQRVDIEVLI